MRLASVNQMVGNRRWSWAMHYRLSRCRPALLGLGLWLGAALPVSAQVPATGLSGRWVLNLELSDQMEEKLSEAMRLGAFSSRELMNRLSNGKNQPDNRELMSSVRPALQLVITQDDSSVAISDAGGFMVGFPTDGRKVEEYLLSGETLEIVTRWKDRTLTIERKQKNAGWVREAFTLDSNGRLVVTVRVKTPLLPRTLEFRRVYDSTPGT
jgi:hypothetical protein